MKCTPMVTLSTWQWWKPPSSRSNTLSSLVLGADGGEAFLRQRQRNLLVAGAVQQQERTGHLLHDAVEAEALELLERRLLLDTPSTHCRCSGGTESDSTLPAASSSSRLAQMA